MKSESIFKPVDMLTPRFARPQPLIAIEVKAAPWLRKSSCALLVSRTGEDVRMDDGSHAPAYCVTHKSLCRLLPDDAVRHQKPIIIDDPVVVRTESEDRAYRRRLLQWFAGTSCDCRHVWNEHGGKGCYGRVTEKRVVLSWRIWLFDLQIEREREVPCPCRRRSAHSSSDLAPRSRAR